MRAREFIDEERYRRRRILVPKDPRTIELHKQQYELGKKWAEYQGKLADLKTKLKDDSDQSSKTVRNMAHRALMKRSVGIHKLGS